MNAIHVKFAGRNCTRGNCTRDIKIIVKSIVLIHSRFDVELVSIRGNINYYLNNHIFVNSLIIAKKYLDTLQLFVHILSHRILFCYFSGIFDLMYNLKFKKSCEILTYLTLHENEFLNYSEIVILLPIIYNYVNILIM